MEREDRGGGDEFGGRTYISCSSCALRLRGPPDVGEEVDDSCRYHKGAQRVVCACVCAVCADCRIIVDNDREGLAASCDRFLVLRSPVDHRL